MSIVLVKWVWDFFVFLFLIRKFSCFQENGRCAPGRVLCQNQQNCAESADACEQDHTQYSESFKSTSRCTIEQPNDGFDCFYSINGLNGTCIPYEWFCDGTKDCPLGNDEEHCHKLTTTARPVVETKKKCLTERRCKDIVFCFSKRKSLVVCNFSYTCCMRIEMYENQRYLSKLFKSKSMFRRISSSLHWNLRTKSSIFSRISKYFPLVIYFFSINVNAWIRTVVVTWWLHNVVMRRRVIKFVKNRFITVF